MTLMFDDADKLIISCPSCHKKKGSLMQHLIDFVAPGDLIRKYYIRCEKCGHQSNMIDHWYEVNNLIKEWNNE